MSENLQLPKKYLDIIDDVTGRDRAYFEKHPGFFEYIRPYVKGEFFPLRFSKNTLVWVKRSEHTIGARVRKPLSDSVGLYMGATARKFAKLPMHTLSIEQQQQLLYSVGAPPIEKAVSETESPIETMLLKALYSHIAVVPQYNVGPFRLDFAIPSAKIAIEVDGHDYHKTKEQRTHDSRRDRFLQANGWRILRFTGTEIYRDVEQCVREILAIVKQMGGAV